MVSVESEEQIKKTLSAVTGHAGEQCKLDYGDLECTSMLGEGPVSEIFKGKMKDRFSRRFPDHLIFRIVGGTDVEFAIKVINRRKIEVNRNSAQMIGMVLREKKAMYRLIDCPFVLRIFATAKNDSYVCFITELCERKDMRGLIEKYGALSMDAMIYYGACIIDTLGIIHGRGMAHRDIKPENILITQDWKPRLTDFGCVKLLYTQSSKSAGSSSTSSSSVTSSDGPASSSSVPEIPMPLLAVDGSGKSEHESRMEQRKRYESQSDTDFVGTPEFMAPEIMTAHELDRERGECLDYLALDLWSLGMMFYQWATAKLMISKGSEYLTLQAVAQWTGPVDRTVDEVSALVTGDSASSASEKYKAWFDIIDGLLQKDPSKRLSLMSLRSHALFSDIDWDDLVSITPPQFNSKAPSPVTIPEDPMATPVTVLSDALASAGLLSSIETAPVVFRPDDCD